VGRCARPCRGGSIARVKEGRRSATEAFIAVWRAGGRVPSGATRRRGVGEGCGASTTVGRRGMAYSGPFTALVGGARASGA
jgi:hypothetical protein